MNQIALILPAESPGCLSQSYLRQLLSAGFAHILVVDCGAELSEVSDPAVTLVRSPKDRGIGAALKAGLSHYHQHFSHKCDGVITMDAPVYSVQDAAKAASMLPKHDLVLGIGSEGNPITSGIFRLLYHAPVSDCLTGLRGIANRRLPELLAIKKDSIHFGLRSLIQAASNRWSIAECAIEHTAETLRSMDYVMIYHVLLGCFCRFLASSALSSLMDIALFALLTKLVFTRMDLVMATLLGTAIARILSSLANYAVNKWLVFQHDGSSAASLGRFTIMCIGQGVCSWLLIVVLHGLTHWDTTALKVVADCTLFLLSYRVQQVWVFRK